MNHIHRLTAQVRALKAEQKATNQGLIDLIAYLHSSKFSCGSELDGYVQVNDVYDSCLPNTLRWQTAS